MVPRAKVYIFCVLAAAFGVLLACVLDWQPTPGPGFAMYLLLSMAAAALKVRLPGLPGTISTGFLLLLAAMAQFSPSEVVMIAAASALVQCLWRPKNKPRAIQVAFSAATLVVSAAFAQTGSREVVALIGNTSIVSMIAVAAFLLYTTNTLLIATVVSLVESRPFGTVWQQCHLWAFPYFVCGAILLDITATRGAQSISKEGLLLFPLMLLVHMNYRTLAARFGQGDRTFGAKP